MASIDVEIASRTYSVACRDGEEAHLRSLAALVDRKANEAADAVGGMGEARHLLFASLLLADELMELRHGGKGGEQVARPNLAVAEALEQLAGRIEKLAEKLEQDGPTP